MKNNIVRIVCSIAMSLLLVNCCATGMSYRQVNNYSDVARLNYAVVALVEPDSEQAELAGIPENKLDSANSTGLDHQAYCTGFYISETEVMTAGHCVSRSVIIMTPWGPERQTLDESPIGDFKKIATYSTYLDDPRMKTYTLYFVEKFDSVQDVAILKILSNQKKDSKQEILKIGKTPAQGDHVIVIGHPSGLMWTLTEGIVSYPTRLLKESDGDQKIIQVTAGIYFGNSGGPLIDDYGNVVGVASKMVVPHLGLFCHPDSLRAIFNQK